MTDHDADDTQPFANPGLPGHRIYIRAEWSPPGEGAGHPKLSGGVSVDTRSGEIVANGFNRKDQIYSITEEEALTRRIARATAEYDDAVLLLGAGNRYEVRSVSGNNYDVSNDLTQCDCPDWYRQEMSGYTDKVCKHILMVQLALTDPTLPDGLFWSCAKWGEVAGVAERTVMRLCQSGYISATKKHNVWMIPPSNGEDTSYDYVTNVRVNIPNLIE